MKESILRTLLDNMFNTCKDLGKMTKTEAIQALVDGLNRTHPFASLNATKDEITLHAGDVVLTKIICEPWSDMVIVITSELTDELFKSMFKVMTLTIHVINMQCAVGNVNHFKR